MSDKRKIELSPAEKQSVRLVLIELERAKNMWPEWPDDLIHQAAIVGEEAGEVLQSSLEATYEEAPADAAVYEAVQTAAVALRFISNNI